MLRHRIVALLPDNPPDHDTEKTYRPDFYHRIKTILFALCCALHLCGNDPCHPAGSGLFFFVYPR